MYEYQASLPAGFGGRGAYKPEDKRVGAAGDDVPASATLRARMRFVVFPRNFAETKGRRGPLRFPNLLADW